MLAIRVLHLPGLTVLGTPVVRQPIVLPEAKLGQMIDSTVTMEAGIVVTLSVVEVEMLSVVSVANCVAVGVDWHCAMLSNGLRRRYMLR